MKIIGEVVSVSKTHMGAIVVLDTSERDAEGFLVHDSRDVKIEVTDRLARKCTVGRSVRVTVELL